MSDLMLEAVLRMPIEMAMDSDLSRAQFYDRAQQAMDEIERLQAEVEREREIANTNKEKWLEQTERVGGLLAEVERLRPYHQAIDDAAITTWTLNNSLNAKEQLAKIIEWEIQVALDPAVNGGKVLVSQETVKRIAELEAFIETIDHQYDAMQQIKSWCRAYPVSFFPEPDWVEVQDKLGKVLLSQVSASNMRHVIDGVNRIITECEKDNTQCG